MALAMARPIKHPKSGMYVFRKRVPEDLKAILGKSEVFRSLGTKDPAEARRRHRDVADEVEREWALARAQPERLPHKTVVALAGEVYREWAKLNPDEPGEPDIWRHVIRLGREAQTARPLDALRISTDRHGRLGEWLGSDVDRLLARHGYRVDDDSRLRVLREAAKALVQAAEQRRREAEGDYSADPVAGRFPSLPHRPAAKTGTGSVTGLFEAYAAERKLSPKTTKTWRGIVAAFVKFIEYDDAERVTRPDVVRWKDSLVSAGKLSPRTINMVRLTVLRTVFGWGVNNSHLSSNPATGVKVAVRDDDRPSRRGYSDEEAATILRAARAETTRARRWLPWLAALTGARISELANLRGTDVFRQDGVLLIRITPEASPTGRLKNRRSARSVPMHAALAAEGFPEVAAEAGEAPIFAELGENRAAQAPHVISRWVRSKLGISDKALAPNHSWRHRFRTLGHRYGMSEAAIDAVEGHAPRTQGQRYGERPIELMRELEKLPHPLGETGDASW